MDKVLKSTLNYYDEYADNFISNTLNVDMSELYQFFFHYLRVNKGKILDVGCGTGRDTKYFVEKGFDVVAFDASYEMYSFAKKYTGLNILNIEFEDIEWEEGFDGIWACASLLHVRYRDMEGILKKLFKSLKNKGVLYASFKYGDESYIKENRFFECYTEKKFNKIVSKIPNVKVEKYKITEDVRADRNNEKWLNVICIKK